MLADGYIEGFIERGPMIAYSNEYSMACLMEETGIPAMIMDHHRGKCIYVI